MPNIDRVRLVYDTAKYFRPETLEMSKQRPLSPHLQIYRLPLTAVLSILHRITGALLALGLAVLVIWLAAAAWCGDVYDPLRDWFGGWFGQVLLIAWTVALYFHWCNGIRHLIWDLGHGFDLATVDKTAVIALLATVILSAATWMLAASW